MLFETLIFIDSIISNLNSGLSVVKSIESASKENKSKISDFSKYFLKAVLNGETANNLCLSLKKSENKILFIILEMGIKGLPILQVLENFKKEVHFSNKIEIETYQRILPLKLILPLLFFYFPALILLFIGPFVLDFLKISQSM